MEKSGYPQIAQGRIKSILKPKSKPSGNNINILNAKGSDTSVGSKDEKKRVEITTPPRPSKTLLKHNYRETPLPRVALLPPKATATFDPLKQKPKPKIFMSSNINKTGPNDNQKPTKAASTTKIRPVRPKRSTSQTINTFAPAVPKKIKKRSKKKKKKSKSMSDVIDALGVALPKIDNPGKEYMKELVTINELLKTITDSSTNNREGQAAQILQGFARPFSAIELKQLLTSVDKVATIHQIQQSHSVPTTAMDQKPKPPSSEQTEEVPLDSSKVDETPSTSKPKKKKVKKSKRSKSKSSIIKADKLEDAEAPPKPAAGSASKNLASKKTLRSSVKSLKSKSSKKFKNSDTNKDDLNSELSELDLVKSALFNRKYYEESMALEAKSKDDLHKKEKSLKHSSKKKAAAKELKRIKAAHNSAHELVTNTKIASASSSTHSVKQEENVSSSKAGGPLPLAPLKPTDTDNAYDKALDHVLINYSHVLRPPSRHKEDQGSSQHKIENRRVILSKQILEEQLQKKSNRGGVISRGMLDIEKIIAPDEMTKETKNEVKVAVKGPKGSLSIDELFSDDKSKRQTRKSRSPSTSQDKKLPTKPIIDHAIVHPVDAYKRVSTPIPTRATTHFPESRRMNPVTMEPQVTNIAMPHPSRWNEQSIAHSLFKDYPEAGSSRWSFLNMRTLERNQEMKARAEKHQQEALKENHHHDQKKINHDPGEERKAFLKNLEKAKKAFDNFGVHDVTDRRHMWKTGKAQYNNTYGLDTSAFKRTH